MLWSIKINTAYKNVNLVIVEFGHNGDVVKCNKKKT